MRKIQLFLLLLLQVTFALGISPIYSTAGFYELPGSGREVYDMNVAWHFYKGDVAYAFQENFDDSNWQVVSLPDGIELLPEEASGSINYQGVVWYRKHFTASLGLKGKKVFIHFEGIMGKSKVWVNGQLVKEHVGGYLPVIADITSHLRIGKSNVIAVCADNSNDESYAPGKPQYAMDFTYFGGIYRDCWMIVHNNLHITDANFEQETGGGGLYVTFPTVEEKRATLSLQLHLRNEGRKAVQGKIDYELQDIQGRKVASVSRPYKLFAQDAAHFQSEIKVKNPSLWSPETPTLYWLKVLVKDAKGYVLDGYRQRIGIRKIEMRGQEGFWLNGKPYDKLIGGNRHQDFAIIGNAMTNSLHWRDAYKLKNAGMKIIRSAHYPTDPAFLDACDELGLFFIDATPGWQFYNKAASFVKSVENDIRNMVRRDRNRPSLLFYEPVLNETLYPSEFAQLAKRCVDEEMKSTNALSATDLNKNGVKGRQYGADYYPVIYTHPNSSKLDSVKVYFTREFGDNVDDWSANNSTSRVCRAWGEIPMLIQAKHYAKPSYTATCIESLYCTGNNHLGGTLWCSFDHQRGCNVMTFYGGIMDVYRQPKTAYYMFQSQRPAEKNEALPTETGPMVYVAHEMTPFSPADVTVYSNCEEVRLTVNKNGKQFVWKRSDSDLKMPSPVIEFKNAYDFMDIKRLARAKKQDEYYMLAEGLINGKVVATHKRVPARKAIKLRLRTDNDGMPLVANGADIVVVIAEVVDEDGTVKRLNNYNILYSIEGEGVLLNNAVQGTNPIRANWGSAPALIRTTVKPGKIKVKATIFGKGVNSVQSGEIEFNSMPSTMKMIYDSKDLEADKLSSISSKNEPVQSSQEIERLRNRVFELEKQLSDKTLIKMEEQQEQFGEK